MIFDGSVSENLWRDFLPKNDLLHRHFGCIFSILMLIQFFRHKNLENAAKMAVNSAFFRQKSQHIVSDTDPSNIIICWFAHFKHFTKK